MARDRSASHVQERSTRGNQANEHEPDNRWLETIRENRSGVHMTLSVLCILIGQRLGLPIVGIGLPYHFIAKYNSLTDPILFDPFHKGRILTPEKCSEMVRGFGIPFEPQYLSPVSHREILTRMIQNLVIAYQKLGEEDKVGSLREYSEILQGRG